MPDDLQHALSAAVRRLLRPLVRILLRNGMPYAAFADLAKGVFVEVADSEFPIANRKQTISRVSVITGLSRKEVLRVKRLATPDDAAVAQRYHRAARTISGWVRDRGFCDAHGAPLALPFEGASPCFAELVRRYGGDVPARSVLDELQRVGAIERAPDGQIRLLARAYVPSGASDDKLGILGMDVADLVATIDHNLTQPAAAAFFQRKASYDNLPEEALPELRALVARDGQALLETFDRWLAQRDRDINPAAGGSGRRRAGIAVFYFEDEVPKE